MEFKKAVLLLTVLLVALAAIPVVSAQTTNILETISGVFGDREFGSLYNEYWWIIDLIIYLFFFGYIGKLTLGNQFQGKGGGLGIIVGVALSISVVFFESTSGFRLGNIGPFGLAVALVVFGWVVWKLFHGMGFGGATSAAWSFVAIYGSLLTIAAPVFKWVQDNAGSNPWLNALVGILNIGLLVSVVAIIWGLGKKVPGLFGGGASAGLGGGLGGILGRAGGDRRRTEMGDVRGDRREMGREKGDITDVGRAGAEEGSIAGIINNELRDMQAIRNFMQELQAVAPRLNAAQAQAIARARAAALREAIKRLLELSKRAKKANDDAEKRLKRVVSRVGKELRDRSKMEAKDAKTNAAKGQKQAAYDTIIQQRNRQIDQRLTQLRLEAYQGERAEENIKRSIEQVIQAEEQIMVEVENLVRDLERGNIHHIQEVTTHILNNVQGAEITLAASEKLALGIRQYANDMRQKFFRTETAVKQQAMASEYELVRGGGPL